MADSITTPEPQVGGYVLAGGRSSRMGRDKALLELAGRPLIAHAVAKLRRVTGEANILAGAPPGNPALAPYAPEIFDTHPNCGPLGGIEAALRHSTHSWNLILPVDVPFLPATLLEWWIRDVTAERHAQCVVSIFRVDGRPQPGVLMLHRAVRPYLAAALDRGNYKLLPALEDAARQLAPPHAPPAEAVPYIIAADELFAQDTTDTGIRPVFTEAQRRSQPLWFANLNTPEDFSEAERHAEALDAPGKPGALG